MAVDTYNTAKGQPQFSDSGAPDIAVDPTEVAKYAGFVGNRIVGTSAQRSAFNHPDWPHLTSPWQGLEWHDTTDKCVYLHSGSGWVLDRWVVPPELNVLGEPSGAQAIGPAVAALTQWSTPTVSEKFTWNSSLGEATASFAGGLVLATLSIGSSFNGGQGLIYKNGAPLPNFQTSDNLTLTVPVRMVNGDKLQFKGYNNGILTMSRMQVRVDWMHA